MSENDEVGQELDRALRVTVTAAGQVAESVARRRAEQQRTGAASSVEEARRSEREFSAQRDGARLVYRQAADLRWWQQAQGEDVAQVWQATQTWADRDPQAAAAADLVRAHVARRWGLDVATVTADPSRSLREQADDLAPAIADRALDRWDREAAAGDRTGPTPDVSRGGMGGPGQGSDAMGAGEDQRTAATARRGQVDESGPTGQTGPPGRPAQEQPAPGGERELVGAGARSTAAGSASGGVGRRYARARAEEMTEAPATAMQARLDAAQAFPVPVRQAVATKTATPARAARGAAGAALAREHDLGR